MDILAEIKTQYETFGKARRQISDIILENPAKCCFLYCSALSPKKLSIQGYVHSSILME